MKKINQHRGRVSLKESMLKNSRAWRRLTKESGAGERRAESPGGEGGLTRDQHCTTSLETMMSVRTPEGFVGKSTASHIIQAWNDLFIKKDEAYIMNRKKKGEVHAQKGRECVRA